MKTNHLFLFKTTRFFALVLGLLVVTFLFVSCLGLDGQSETSYLPFKSSNDGKWGLISTDGKVLFEEEFKDQPTSVINDRFLVKNGNGLWEIFTAEPKPSKIGDEYLAIADFTASVTPAVKKNEKISLIDVNGEVKTILDKAGSKSIVGCTRFMNGFAIIGTEDDLCGVINTSGQVVIDPKYSFVRPIPGGYFVVGEKNKNENDDFVTIKILDGKANQKLEMKVGTDQKYVDFNPDASNLKYLAVCSLVDGEKRWGYVDYSNNVIIKPSAKIKSFSSVCDDNVIFYDGDNFGVMNFDGETILRAKYDMLSWADDDLLIAYDSDSKYSLINLEGDKLTKEGYLEILPFYGGSQTAVKISDNSWGFINKKGEEVNMKDCPDIYYISDHSACSYVESDFVDMDAIISKVQLSKGGLMGYNLDMTPLQVVKAYNEIAGNSEKLGLTPDDNRGRDQLCTEYASRGYNISSKLYYNRYLTESDNNMVIWSNDKPAYIEVYVSGSKLDDKTDLLYSKVAAVIKSYGKVVKENSRAAIVKLTDNRGWVITNDGSRVMLKIYNSNSYWDYYIDNFAKDGESTKTNEVRSSINDYVDADTIAIVDSIDY